MQNSLSTLGVIRFAFLKPEVNIPGKCQGIIYSEAVAFFYISLLYLQCLNLPILKSEELNIHGKCQYIILQGSRGTFCTFF